MEIYADMIKIESRSADVDTTRLALDIADAFDGLILTMQEFETKPPPPLSNGYGKCHPVLGESSRGVESYQSDGKSSARAWIAFSWIRKVSRWGPGGHTAAKLPDSIRRAALTHGKKFLQEFFKTRGYKRG